MYYEPLCPNSANTERPNYKTVFCSIISALKLSLQTRSLKIPQNSLLYYSKLSSKIMSHRPPPPSLRGSGSKGRHHWADRRCQTSSTSLPTFRMSTKRPGRPFGWRRNVLVGLLSVGKTSQSARCPSRPNVLVAFLAVDLMPTELCLSSSTGIYKDSGLRRALPTAVMVYIKVLFMEYSTALFLSIYVSIYVSYRTD